MVGPMGEVPAWRVSRRLMWVCRVSTAVHETNIGVRRSVSATKVAERGGWRSRSFGHRSASRRRPPVSARSVNGDGLNRGAPHEGECIRDPKTNNRPFYVRVVEVPSTPLPSDPPCGTRQFGVLRGGLWRPVEQTPKPRATGSNPVAPATPPQQKKDSFGTAFWRVLCSLGRWFTRRGP